MYAKSIRPSAKREVQEERSAKRAMSMCPRSGQIFFFKKTLEFIGVGTRLVTFSFLRLYSILWAKQKAAEIVFFDRNSRISRN